MKGRPRIARRAVEGGHVDREICEWIMAQIKGDVAGAAAILERIRELLIQLLGGGSLRIDLERVVRDRISRMPGAATSSSGSVHARAWTRR